jgi:hypothetical protein
LEEPQVGVARQIASVRFDDGLQARRNAARTEPSSVRSTQGITPRMNAKDAAGHFCSQCQQQLIMKTFGAYGPGSCDILAKRKAVAR